MVTSYTVGSGLPLTREIPDKKGYCSMKKQWVSAALALLLILMIPVAVCADVIFPAPDTMTVGQEVNHLLATLDPGGTVWASPEQMPEGLYLVTEEFDGGVNVYLRGVPTVPGTYDLIINYSGSTSICTLRILPDESAQPTLVSVSVETLPLKTQYTVGDTLDPAGLSLLLEMSDGSTQIVTEGYSLSPILLETAGTQRIEVDYSGVLCYFDVEVEPQPEVIESIVIAALPEKVVYKPGERLDLTGLIVRVYTNNGPRDVGPEELSCSPMDLIQPGPQLITVSYEGLTCSFTIQVVEEETPVAMTVSRMPTKLDYTVGEALDPTGLILVVTGSLDSIEYLDSGYTCEPGILEQAGVQEIVVRFEDLECRFHVTVREAPAAHVSPAPVEATPDAEPDPASASTAPARPHPAPLLPVDRIPRGESGTQMAGVVAGAALAALLVLAFYVLFVNRSVRAYFAESLRDLFRRKT